ncbi:RcnB family protein [Acetobacter sp.]|uniref:RcnB family protein n=1 Tax=Acetobacter sp. TaxID=440 RepID=UPI0039E7C144
MQTKSIALVLAAIVGSMPVCAMAQPMPGGGRHDGGGPGGGRGGGYGDGPGDHRGFDNRGRGMGGRANYGPPPPPMNNRWRPGLRYWGGDPWIDNWQSYRGLYAPPYGYRWVQAGDQFLLTAIATGIISAVVAGSVMNGGPR